MKKQKTCTGPKSLVDSEGNLIQSANTLYDDDYSYAQKSEPTHVTGGRSFMSSNSAPFRPAAVKNDQYSNGYSANGYMPTVMP